MKKLLITATLLLLLSIKPLFAGVDKGIDVAEVQRMLTELCIDAGPIDGVWGRKTEAAVKDFLYNYSGQFGENDMKILKSHHWLFTKEKKCNATPVKQPLRKNYRKGSLDLERRLAELSKKGVLRSKCSKGYYSYSPKPEVIKTLKPADQNYGGSDPRVQSVSNLLIELTAACFAGSKSACNSGLESLRQYAELDAPFENNQAKFKSNLRTVNVYIMNTSFISPAINFLSVYDQQIGLTNQELLKFDEWLKNIVKRYRKKQCRSNKLIDYREHGHRNPWSTQNHCISSAISSAALGSWLNDKKLLNEGVKQWKKTFGTIRKDGSLPHETSRGSKAIQYSGYTITKLMRLAEILRLNGIDLYSLDVRGKTIHDNVSFYLDVMENPSLIHSYAKFNINSGSNLSYKDQEEAGFFSGHHAWIPLYMLRFPNHPNTNRLKRFSGEENKHTKVLSEVVKLRYSGNYGLDADPKCFYSKP